MTRPLRTQHDDRGVVAIELAIVLPIIIGLLVTSITFAGLFQTKSQVVGAARDGARALALSRPSADLNSEDEITVELASERCPALTDQSYQSDDPPTVTARASTTYDVNIPFIGEWTDIYVFEEATMPCG